MIAKQIEPPVPKVNGSSCVSSVTYRAIDGELMEAESTVNARPGCPIRYDRGGLDIGLGSRRLRPSDMDKLEGFLAAIRHLREPESEGTEIKGCSTCAIAARTLRECGCSEPSSVSKDLEEAIELLREFVRYGKNRELDAWLDEIDRDVVCFLSRVGGDND